MPNRPSLRWGRVAAFAVILVLIGVGVLQMNGRADTQPRPARQTPHGTRVDLSERGDRFRLSAILNWERRYFDTRLSLYRSCEAGSPEAYYAEGTQAFRRPESEEVLIQRHAADRDATAWGAPSLLPPPPPEPGGEPVPPPPRSLRQYELDAAEVDAIEAELLALLDLDVQPVGGESGNDGQGFVLEFCHRGRYGLYSYHNPDPAKPLEKRVLDLANRILASGGARPLDYFERLTLPH